MQQPNPAFLPSGSCRLFQLLNVVNHWDHLQAEEARLYTLLVLAAAALGFASTVALPPRFYLRHRCAAAAAPVGAVHVGSLPQLPAVPAACLGGCKAGCNSILCCPVRLSVCLSNTHACPAMPAMPQVIPGARPASAAGAVPQHSADGGGHLAPAGAAAAGGRARRAAAAAACAFRCGMHAAQPSSQALAGLCLQGESLLQLGGRAVACGLVVNSGWRRCSVWLPWLVGFGHIGSQTERRNSTATLGLPAPLSAHGAGTKLLLPILQRTAAALPPIETAALQIVLVRLTWNPSAYCDTPVSTCSCAAACLLNAMWHF